MIGADPHPLGATDYSALFPRAQAGKPDVLMLAKGKQWIRKCDHQSFQDVYVVKSRRDQKGEWDLFEIAARVEASDSLERTCQELGHA